MNLTPTDLGIIAVIGAAIQTATGFILKAVIENSIKHANDRMLEVFKKKREIRIKYLIDAFRVLAKRGSLPPGNHPELAPEIESALIDIQLFGSECQIKAARLFAQAEAKKEVISMNDLLDTFRVELRVSIRLSKRPGMKGSRAACSDLKNSALVLPILRPCGVWQS